MKGKFSAMSLALLLAALLSGCGAIGEKSESLCSVYGILAAISFVLLICYVLLVKPRKLWFLVLFASVFVVNTGYFWLSMATTLDSALMANRLSYLGSVFLPMAMLMIILGSTGLRCRKWLPWVLLVINLGVFFVAASPGYLTIYYKSVSLDTSHGITMLSKDYGPWHSLYLYFLVGYFAAMVAAILQAALHKKLESPTHALMLCAAVLINISVWLLEQLVHMEFELLSISYILTELFLMGLHMLLQENHRKMQALQQPAPTPAAIEVTAEQCSFFLNQLPLLTPTERLILDLYVAGKGSKEVLLDQHIKENTLKYHNRNIYGKLGVNSRKQLVMVAQAAGYNKE